jgi:hypothetical protein
MKKLLLVFMTLVPLMLYADIAEDIAMQGDKVWDNLLFLYKRDARWIEIGAVSDFSQHRRYLEKATRIPLLDFSNVITDSGGNKYYHFSETDSSPLFIFRHNADIQMQIDMLHLIFEDVGTSYEVIGRIIDAIAIEDTERRLGTGDVWDGRNIVIMDISAFRVKNKVCVMVDTERVVPIAEELVNTFLETQLMRWTVNIPENATSVPANLEPEEIAKWFLFFGSIRKSSQIWNQLCSIDKNIISNSGLLRPLGQSWWRMVSAPDYKYFFVGSVAAQNSATSQTFLYGIRERDKTIETAKSITVTREQSGQWRVSLFQ